jgi:hypothetical protein
LRPEEELGNRAKSSKGGAMVEFAVAAAVIAAKFARHVSARLLR